MNKIFNRKNLIIVVTALLAFTALFFYFKKIQEIDATYRKKVVIDIPNKSDLSLPPFHKVLTFDTTNDILINEAKDAKKVVLPILKGNIAIEETRLKLNGEKSFDPLNRDVKYAFYINGAKVCMLKTCEVDLYPEEDLEVQFDATILTNEYPVVASYYNKFKYAQALSNKSVYDKK